MSKIEWTDITLNIHGGCTKISPGCDNCYAIPMSRRLAGIYKGTGINALKKYADTTTSRLEWTGKVNTNKSDIIEAFIRLPKTVSKKVFISSMSDLFHKDVPNTFILNVMDEISAYNQHIFQFLTKRPENAYKFFSGYLNHDEIYKNVWLGVTAENQAMADKRIPLLLKTPAAVRFVSFEPLLNEIIIEDIDYDWAIIGCESGTNKRDCNLQWVYALVEQHSGKVPIFIKQLNIDGKVVKDWDDPLFPEDLKIRDFPK